MTHLVFGTGLVGGYIAGVLIKQHFETYLLGRDKHQHAMRDGLTLSDLQGNEAQLEAPRFWQANTDLAFDCIWLAVKCTSIDSSIDQLRGLVRRNTIIICCQNGFGSDQTLRTAFPNNVILNAVVGFNIAEQNGNHLHRSTDGHLVVESHAQIDTIIQQLNCPLMPSNSSSDMLAERWAKLQLNLSNPVNALADVPTKAMMEDEGYRAIISTLMRELLSLTQAMGLALPKLTTVPAKWLPTVVALPNWMYLKLAQKMLAIDPTARQSMWWDLSQGKTSEIMYLNQAVIEQAEHYKIECPANRKIVDLIKAVERGDEKIGFSSKQLRAKLLQ